MTLLTYDGKGFKSAWSAGLNDKYYATTNTRNEAVVNGLTIAKAYNVVSYVFRCVKIISNEISRLPRALVNEAGKDVTEQYKDLMVTDDLLYSMTGSKYLFGAAYAKKERNDYGFNPQLRWLISPSVQPRINPVTRLVDGFIRGEERPPFIPVEDMVYIWNKNYTDETQPGAGDSQVALGPASAIYAKDVLIANFFNGGAIKVTVFPVNPSTPEPDRINFQNWLNRRLSNVQNAFKNIVMRATDLNPVVIGSDIKDTEAVELTTQAREDIAAAHGMTVSIVNGDYKYATADDQYVNFILQTVVPEADRMFEAFTKQYYADFGLKLITQPKKLEVMQNLQLAQTSAVSQATGKPVMLVSEGRELLELKTDLTPDEQQQLGIAPATIAGIAPSPVNAVVPPATEAGKPIRVDNWPVGKPKRVNFDAPKPEPVKAMSYDELTAALTEWRKEALASVKAGKSIKSAGNLPDEVTRPILDELALTPKPTAKQVRAVFESHWPIKPEAEAEPVDELKRGNDLLEEVISLLKFEK